MKSIRIAILLFIFSIVLYGCSKNDVCQTLSEKSKDKDFISKLEKWVDKKNFGDHLTLDKSNPSPDPPGDYLVEKDSEISGIIGSDMQISVIMGEDDTVDAVFFFKGSYRGLVVFLQGKRNLLISDDHLRFVSNRAAVLCIDRD